MIDTIRLIELYQETFGAPMSADAAANLRDLARRLHEDAAMTDPRWRAYALATARTEAGRDFAIRTEQGPRAYFDRYEAGTKLGNTLGNLQPGDGFLYRGRGYVQITGRANYAKFSPLVGLDLVADPDAALRSDIAYEVLSLGMLRGLFTGRRLAHYLYETVRDYVGARRIINGQDRALNIALDAENFESILKRCES